jgi:hypothetical protein
MKIIMLHPMIRIELVAGNPNHYIKRQPSVLSRLTVTYDVRPLRGWNRTYKLATQNYFLKDRDTPKLFVPWLHLYFRDAATIAVHAQQSVLTLSAISVAD